MRIVGRRHTEPVIEAQANADALCRGLAVVDAAATFGWATTMGQRKGVYRFKTFEAMEAHRIDCLARAMARTAALNQDGPVPRPAIEELRRR
ncbi:MAG TPA: hypothetical protein VFL86_17315 [Burkholderiaceae bacterium]|nr:hypothetical protein [Burkholderiaceae bacterium]